MSITNSDLLVKDTETGGASQQHDDLRIEDVELLTQVDSTVSDICRSQCAPRWAVFEQTGEVDGVFVQSDAPDRTAEPLARLSDKRPPRFGLFSAWRFTKEENLGVGLPSPTTALPMPPRLHYRQDSMCLATFRRAAPLSEASVSRASAFTGGVAPGSFIRECKRNTLRRKHARTARRTLPSRLEHRPSVRTRRHG